MHWSSEAAKYTNRNSKDIILQQKSSFRIDANFKAVLFLGKKPLLVYFVSSMRTRSHRNFCTFGWTFWITSTRGFHSSFNGSRHDTIYHPFGRTGHLWKNAWNLPKKKRKRPFRWFCFFCHHWPPTYPQHDRQDRLAKSNFVRQKRNFFHRKWSSKCLSCFALSLLHK